MGSVSNYCDENFSVLVYNWIFSGWRESDKRQTCWKKLGLPYKKFKKGFINNLS
jgi:hypothetical protein